MKLRILPLSALILASCQQSPLPPEEPPNLRPSVTLTAEPADVGRAPFAVELIAQASDPEGKPLTYYWVIGTESFEGQAMRRHTFEEPGEYSVTVTVSDDAFDATDELTITVLDEDEPGV